MASSTSDVVVSSDLMSFVDEYFVIKLTSDLSVTGLVSPV